MATSSKPSLDLSHRPTSPEYGQVRDPEPVLVSTPLRLTTWSRPWARNNLRAKGGREVFRLVGWMTGLDMTPAGLCVHKPAG